MTRHRVPDRTVNEWLDLLITGEVDPCAMPGDLRDDLIACLQARQEPPSADACLALVGAIAVQQARADDGETARRWAGLVADDPTALTNVRLRDVKYRRNGK